jgi:hypothetical protein
MRRRIDPKRIVLGMMPRACKECSSIQHVYFKSQEEYDDWDCPTCRERQDDEDLQLHEGMGGEVQDPS